MKKSQYTAEQIAFILKQTETGTPVQEVCRKMGICEQYFYPLVEEIPGQGDSGSSQPEYT